MITTSSSSSPWAPDDSDSANPVAIDILLIDDNEDYLFLIRKALESRDPRYRITGVSSPDEAYALLEERAFQLVLLDYKFPGGNGLQVIRRLKEKATFVPTVMITAFGDESLALEAMREGALDFVPKAGDFVEVLPEVVGRALERGRTIRERIRTRRSLERRNRELSLLVEVSEVASEPRVPEELLAQAARRVGDFLGAREATGWLLDQDGRLDVGARPGGSGPSRALLDRVLNDREILVEEAGSATSWVLTPLCSHEASVGVLAHRVAAGRAPDAAERGLLASVGRQLGVALAHSRLWRQLTETQQYLSELVGSAGDEIVTTDCEGRVRTWNAGAERLYGRSAGEVIDASWESLWPEARHAEARGLLRRVVERRETIRNVETVRETADGRLIDVMLTLTPVTSPEGEVRGVSCVGKDVTERKQLQAQLVQSEKMSAVGQLISGVAHELNNPLTAVLGYAQLVNAVDTGAKQATYLQKIASEAHRCQRIVQNLLAFARKHEPRAVACDINQVVRDTLELRSYDLRVNGIELECDLASDLPSTRADAHQLQQVLVNLLNNAQQAMLAESRSGRLRVRTSHERRGRSVIRVSVQDSGPGIPPHLRERIFDPFFTTKEPGEGTGLGLSLSYGIVREHGGAITIADSELGGACFDVRLPVLPDPMRGVEGKALDAVDAAEAVERGLDGVPRRILVVDDQDSIRAVFSDLLSADGHRVDTAADGWEALEKLESGRDYDLLIVDLRMPDLGGDRLFECIAERHPELAQRVVFATGDLLSDETRGFIERTGSPLLEKPFGVAEVRNALSSFFEETP